MGQRHFKSSHIHESCTRLFCVCPPSTITLYIHWPQAYERLGRKPIVYRMNPKAMPRQQVMG